MARISPTNNDRVRAEMAYDTNRRPLEIGRVVHDALAALARLHRSIDFDYITTTCDQVLNDRPINAPKRLTRPVTQVYSNVGIGVRLLPPLTWKLKGVEVTVASGSIVDLVFETEHPVIVDDHIGNLLGVEVKLAATIAAAELTWTRDQVARHLDGLLADHGDRVLGVATFCLGHAPRSTLTLADPNRTVVPLLGTDLCDFPTGRLC